MWLLGAAFEASESPFVGRLSDTHGAMTPARLALLAAVPVSLGLATGASPEIYVPLMVLAGMSYGALFTPSFSLVSEGAERAGLAQGMAFGLMNAAWAVGAMAGPALAGAVAGVTGDSVPFILAAAGCALAVYLFRPRRAVAARRGQHRTPDPIGRPAVAEAMAGAPSPARGRLRREPLHDPLAGASRR